MDKNPSRGFTLIDIAVVLLIIGCLFGGVLKAQELVRGTKIKRFIADFRNTATMLLAYESEFKALPGDDPLAASRFPGATTASTPKGLIGNGVINGAWDTTNATDETCLIWQHLRFAALASGSTAVNCASDSGYWPRNVAGGQIGVQSNAAFTTIAGAMPGSFVICSKNILGKYVLSIDAALDDGNPATGSVRAIEQALVGGTPSTIGLVEAEPVENFIVCMSL